VLAPPGIGLRGQLLDAVFTGVEGQGQRLALGRFEGGELAFDQRRRHEVARAVRYTLGGDFRGQFKKHEAQARQGTAQTFAITVFKRGAGQHRPLAVGIDATQFIAQAVEPAGAVVVVQGDPRAHLFDVRGRMESIAFNGSGAAQNLYIKSDVKLTAAQLKERLIVLGKEEGLKEVLIVRRLANSISGALSPQSLLSSMLGLFGKSTEVKLSGPVEIVRVSVADGHEELVRGGQFANLNMRVLRDIEATADDAQAYAASTAASGAMGSLSGGSSCTIVTPSILVKEVELQKPSKQTDLLPILKNPYFEQK